MSSPHKDRPSRRDAQEDRPLIPERYRHTVALAALALSIILFLFPVLYGGKTFVSVDSIASHSFDTMLKDAAAQGIFPLWNPYIFCGMPGYGSLTVTGDRWYDLSGWILGKTSIVVQFLLGNAPVGWVVFHYLLFAAGMYLLIWHRVNNRLAAFVGAFGAVFSMYIIIWVMSGHNTKIATMAPFPFLLFLADRLRSKFHAAWAIVAVFLLHLMFMPSHVQMIFYAALSLGVYYIILAVQALRKKEAWAGVVRSALTLAVAAILAFAMDADRYLSVLEYNPHSIRGAGPAIAAPGAADVESASGGLDYEYATQWSLGVGEVMTFFVPTWYGFGNLTYTGPLVRQPLRFNGYWGPQPFTEAAQYMGIVLLLLAVMGFVRNRKDPYVMYLGVMIVFSLLVAFGKEMSLVYDPMFSYLPMFNKFRIPSMILVIVQIFVPILAAYGIAEFMARREHAMSPRDEKLWKRILLGLAVGAVAAVVLRGPISSFYEGIFPFKQVGGRLAPQFGQVQSSVVLEFYNAVVDAVMTDILAAFLLLLAAFGVCYFYMRQRMSVNIFASALIAVVAADLWRIDYRVMDPKPRQDHEAIFATPDYVRALQQDTTLFRTLTFQNGQTPYDNTLAYWRIQSAYGYQGAKMRSYQDVVDIAGLDNPLVWQLMNVKYIISNTPDSSMLIERAFAGETFSVYRFRAALPRVFFVNRYEVTTAVQILNNMANRSFDPRDLAYVQEDPGIKVDPPGPDATASVVKFGLQDLTVSATATGNNLLFLSEVWYPEGWKAFIDGQESPILRLNYLFRGVVVPAGKHTIEMKFEPRGFELGKNLSLGVNLVLLVGFGFLGVQEVRKRRAA